MFNLFKRKHDWQEHKDEYKGLILCSCNLYYNPELHGCPDCGELKGSKPIVMVRKVYRYDKNREWGILNREYVRSEEAPAKDKVS